MREFLRRRMMVKGGLRCKPLADCTWEEIVELANANMCDCWAIGDTKDLTLTTNEIITMQIVGFNHDDLTAGGKAAVSFVMKDCLQTKYKLRTGVGGSGYWYQCDFRLTNIPTLLEQIPIKNSIKLVNKDTYYEPTSSIKTTEDKLWLISSKEANLTYSETGGRAYAYFSSDANRLKNINGTPNEWWTRTTITTDKRINVSITEEGKGKNTTDTVRALGIAYGFCL